MLRVLLRSWFLALIDRESAWKNSPATYLNFLVEIRRMAILAECDICGHQHRIKDGLVGTFIRCQACGVQLVVPKDCEITSANYLEEGGRLRRRDFELQPATNYWTWLFMGLVTTSLILLLTLIVWVFSLLACSGARPIGLHSSPWSRKQFRDRSAKFYSFRQIRDVLRWNVASSELVASKFEPRKPTGSVQCEQMAHTIWGTLKPI